MTKKMAPSFDVAQAVLDRHFRKSHQIMTTRQLKSACGGSGSNETYAEYIKRWKAERVEETGVLSTLLSLQNHIESFGKTTGLLIGTLSDQLRMCPFDLASAEEETSRGVADASDSEEDAARAEAAQTNESDAFLVSEEQEQARVEHLADQAAKASEPRFIDDDSAIAPQQDHRRHPSESARLSDGSRSIPTQVPDPSLSRADTGSRQSALPLGTNQSETDERETLDDRRAN